MSGAEEENNIGRDMEPLPPTASFTGSVIGPGSKIGPFRIERELGRGAVGVVYLAHDTKLDRPVAIKSLPAEVMGNPKVRSRFAREARVLASLNHPNIATIYEELEEAEGVGYLVLEYVPGQTLAERIAKGPLKLQEVLSIALQIAEAVAAAHEHDVIHRDLKPANIKITPEGKVKVLDFGLAKAVGGQALDLQSTVTEPGRVIGTPAYMSPEQARGKPTDKRSDIWSFGCVLYEMLTGRIPFKGETISDTLANILDHDADWQALPAEAGPQLRKLLYKCLEKDPDSRYQSAARIRRELYSYQATLSAKAFDVKLLWRAIRRPRVAVCIILILLTLGLGISWLMHRSSKVRWAGVEAIPEIERLIEQDKYLAAFSLAGEAEKYIPKDPMLVKLWPRITRDYSVITTPPGADIFFKEYSDIESKWEYLGVSPLENIRFPHGIYRWKITAEGFETRELVVGRWTDAPKPLNVELSEEGRFPHGIYRLEIRKEGFEPVDTFRPANTLSINLDEKGSLPLGMVSITERPVRVRLAYFRYGEGEAAVRAPAYLIDKYEVTNEQFKEFVDKGGYQNRDYWKYEFVKDGKILSWEGAMDEFRDTTGRPAPSTWEGGTYPNGQGKYPVCGVSWYEAAAYAEFAGKNLPTIYHWSTAACAWDASVIVSFSNFGTGGAAPIGSHPGMGHTGLYDMAGNVKEWCWNAVDDSGELRYILGGAWSEADYMFTHADARSPWDRSPTNGFRCVQYPNGSESVPETLFRPVARSFRDYSGVTPVSNEIFQIYKNLYLYDRTNLNDAVESVDESSEYWIKEKILFDAAYGGERVIAYLFLPKRVKPPYQTVVYFPGSGAIRQRSSENLQIVLIDFIIQSGRAVLYPIYKGTCERNDGRTSDVPDETISYRDWIIQLGKDLRRSVDYLETRDDIDFKRLAYYGVSWGAELGPLMLAVEERIKLGIFLVGGLHGCKKLPEVDEVNFAPRVKVPVLMINGKHDYIFPVESSQKPFLEFLGTRDEDKKHILYPGAHGLFRLFSRQIKGDVLGWLDRYLGLVD